jgi:S-adenosylmethionine:diacylglycerol 3-amino-3-carboxypropyl transferase
MIKFDKPANLNGAELVNELATVGIVLDLTTQAPLIDGNGDLWLDINSTDEAKARIIVAAHNGTTVAPEPTIEDKLASVGLSIDDLKTALGL